MALISLIEKIDHFFIHENLQSNIEENGRARILLYAMFITTFFATSYSLYYEFSNTNIHLVKRLANIIGFLTGPIGIILLKYRGNLKETFYGLLILVVVLVFTSTYFSGGIYSIDLLWMIIISVNCFLFVGIRGGLAMMFVAILYFIGFYGMNSLGWKDFKAENEALGVGYILYNHIFLLLLASIITYFFVNGAEKIKRELDEVKERRMKSLGYKYQYITHNANKIIALHRRDGSVSYISPAVKTILGFEEKEMLGVGYKRVLGEVNENQPILCKSKSGKDVWLEVTFTPIRDEIESGDVMISLAKDITGKVLESRKMAELRHQIANDFHDELGNKLASITLNSNILALDSSQDAKLLDIISKIEATSKSLYGHSRDFIWFIDSNSDELNEIFIYLSEFGQDFFRSLSIEFEARKIGLDLGQKITLPLYWGRQIILIFKELMTNAAKHSQCQKVTLDLNLDKGQFIFALSDDGIGFDHQVKMGKGLISIEERANIISSKFEIKPSLSGTQATLTGYVQDKFTS